MIRILKKSRYFLGFPAYDRNSLQIPHILTQKSIHSVSHPVAVNVDDRNHAVLPILSGKLVHFFRISIADSIVQYRKQTFIMNNILIGVSLLELNPCYIFRFCFIMNLSGDRLMASILLFHNAAEETPAALPTIIDGLIERGFTFAPISELIYKDGFYMDHTGMQVKQ